MNVKLKVLRKVLEEAIDNIDAGNSNHSDDELDDIISSLTKLNRGIKRISKREAANVFYIVVQVVLIIISN